MKAEHRKELETNVLADGMGHLVRTMKERPRRSTLGYAAAAVVALLVLLFISQWFHRSREDNAERWFMFENGTNGFLKKIITEAPESGAGKAARMEEEWILLWEDVLKGLAQTNAGDAL